MSELARPGETVTAPGARAVLRPAEARGAATVQIPAGNDDRIPRLFLGVVDLLIVVLALVAAAHFGPAIQPLLLPGGFFEGVLPSIFPVPTVPRPELFPPLSEIVWLIPATAPATIGVIALTGGYARLVTQSFARLAATAAASQLIAIGFSALIVLALKLGSSSRIVIFTYALISAAGLLSYRTGIWLYQRRRRAGGVYAKNVLLIGRPGGPVEAMIEHFKRCVPEHEFRLAAWLAVPPSPRFGRETRAAAGGAPDLPLLGGPRDLHELLVHHPIHEVIAIQASDEDLWLPDVIEACGYFRTRLRIVPEVLLGKDLGELQVAFRRDPLHLPQIELAPRHFDPDALFVKRLIDVVLSAALLTALLPVFALIAVAIKLTTPRLPVFYPWRVVGLNGRPFTGYKFTTMVADADEQKSHLLSRNEMQGPVFKLKDDPRVTRLGWFLRKYSLNELPQLWSVLKGDMSLVGPRPAFPHELERYELWHKRKLCITPGITCLWQVGGRNRISDFNEWVRLDLEYIDRWSVWLDLKILARTAWTVVSGSGS